MSDAVSITLKADQLNLNARKVVKRLHESGFEAYLVGGCVRDLLLDKQPKDFDVSTNAILKRCETCSETRAWLAEGSR